MSTLVAPLASGIAGAASGTAYFYAYGTSYQTPAVAYDIDGIALGTSVALDSNGGIECYVYERVQVIAEDAAGSAVRTFAVQTDSASSLISSSSLTGVDPDTGAQAAGGEILAAAAWNEMYASFGARDFKVRKTGATADQYLKDALTNSTDNFFNVKAAAYGAVGDGSNDDTAEIQAAIDAAIAAGGGVVFFPAGTYDTIAPLVITSQKVKLLGVGHRASIIRNRGTASNGVTISSGSSANCGIVIEDLAIVANTTSTGYAVHAAAATGLELRNVRLDLHSVGVRADTRVRIAGSDIATNTSGTVYCVQVDSGGTGDGSEIIGCQLAMASTSANAAVLVQRSDIRIENNAISVSAGANTSKCIYVNHASGTDVVVIGNKFICGSGNYGLYIDANVSFNELGGNRASSGRLFGKTSTLTTASGQVRMSRMFSTSTVTTGSSPYNFDSDIQTHYVTCNSAAFVQLVPTSGSATHGARLTFFVKNSTGSAFQVVSSGSFAPNLIADVLADITSANYVAVVECVYDAVSALWQVITFPAVQHRSP